MAVQSTRKRSNPMQLDRHQSAGYLTNWAARLFTPAIDLRLKALGLSSAYLPVFFALGSGEALTQKTLAEAAAVEQPTMAATLNRMERDGLIRRVPDPTDGRSSLVSLTRGAMAKVPKVQAATRDVNQVALSNLSDAEQAQLLLLLGRVISALAADPAQQKLGNTAARARGAGAVGGKR